MSSKNPTTVVLTKAAQEVKDRLAPAFGLKHILSVGLQLFDALTDTEKISRVAKAKKERTILPSVPQQKIDLQQAIQTIKDNSANSTTESSTVLKLLSPEDAALLTQLQTVLGRQKPRTKTKKPG